ncbi:family 20 glycosylhydrolase [Mycoplasmatota bacterium]|nr:family 20 glycosylhydrolase [Mycoplasmatota bacterium]
MYFIVPQVKSLKITEGYFSINTEINVKYKKQFEEVYQVLNKLFIVDFKNENNNLIFIQNTDLNNEGYILEINNDIITISYHTVNGAFYALKTLKQIINQQENNKIHNLIIHDYPSLKTRGFMLDISRDKIPTMETLYEFINKLSDLKYNHFELYVEGFSFGYPSFSQYTEGNTPVTIEEYQTLEKYCNDLFIDMVPNQNGFGHMAPWLAQDEFKDLAECPDGFTIWGGNRPASTLNPLDEKSIELVKKMYDDMLPYSNSKYFNMNFDEPFELGYGRSKEVCEQFGEGKVYIEYMKKLYEHIKSYNKTPLIWADVLNKHLDLIDEIPDDMIFLDWGYDINSPFSKSLKNLANCNTKFMACPGTSSWCSITGRTMDMLENIKNASYYSYLYKGEGIILTDWGDVGHLQYLPFTYPGLVYGAMTSWGVEEGLYKNLAESLNIMFKDKSKLIGDILLDLGNYYRYEGTYTSNGTKTFHSLIWALNASNGMNGDPLTYYINKMKKNVFPTKNYQTLVNYLNFISSRIELVELECEDGELVISEIKQSIFFLHTLLKVNQMLSEQLNKEEKATLINEIITELDMTIKNHQLIWFQRNRLGGLKHSVQVIEYLKQIVVLYKNSL